MHRPLLHRRATDPTSLPSLRPAAMAMLATALLSMISLTAYSPAAAAAGSSRSFSKGAAADVVKRIQKTLPAAIGMTPSEGQAAIVDLMLHVPLAMRFDLDGPQTAYDEIRLAPLTTLQRASAKLAMGAMRDRSLSLNLSLNPEIEALGVRLNQPKSKAAPALANIVAANTAPTIVPNPGPVRPPGRRVAAISDEGRVFWYAMGASALTSLGTRVFLFFPALILSVPLGLLGASIGPVALAVIFVGMFGGIAVVDAALGALAGAFVFDSMSRYYESSFLSAFVGQILGSGIAIAVIGVMLGFGLLYLGGVTSLVQFIGVGVLSGVGALSILGLMPVVVLGFFASIVIPAVGGAWAMSLTATPIDGFTIDPTWDPESLVGRANPAELRRAERRVYAPLRMALPGT